MAAGIVYHSITTASGVTFTFGSYVPDTASPDVGAFPVTLPVNASGTPIAFGSGVNGVTVPRVALATDSPGVIATGTAGTPSSTVLTVQGIASGTSLQAVNGASQYETVAASQTNQAMGATGAAGDYLSHVIVSPGTAGCGVVTILDNATAVVSFAGGGTTALSNLIPFIIPVGIISTSGAWKITTGANVTCVGVGRFT